MNMIVNCAAYADGCRVANITVDEISDVLQNPDQFVWVGLHEPDAALLHKMQEEFGLHELAIEDALRAHQRAKMEEYGDSLFVVLRPARFVDGRVELGETHIFVGPRYLLTIRHGDTQSYSDVRLRCESSPRLLRKGPGFILYAIMDFVVDHYFPVVAQLEDRLDALEEQIFGGEADRATIEEIYGLKRDLLELKRAVSPLVDVCNRLTRFDLPTIPEDTQPYFRDVYDHAIRINESVDTLRELVTSAFEAKLSLASMNMGEVTKKLAAWAAIIAVPTMIAGIYGMNFKFMPETEWHYGYHAVVTVMFGACGVLYWRFRRAGWL
ncbi:MAG: magnesium/cobalt transporter CorA [Deltaproteobacteria bacterium]|nr:magnesium/cobalt transporter CorA [Deltaproteobacteria bacterium]